MNTASPLVSIVTPVHNEAEYLAECMESVLAQTYQNWDYTIVDNCSTDETVKIARRYAERDRRIRVQEHQQFLPAIPNHNRAVRQISPTSKYCKVLLGDDWMFPECLERMVAVAEERPSVGLVGAFSFDGARVYWTGLPYDNRLTSGREIGRRHFLEDLYLFGSSTTVLYRADLVRSRDPFYNEANCHGDVEVCLALLSACDFGFVHQVLTFTRNRPGSLGAIGEDLQTSFGGFLRILVTYGSDYLTHEELEWCLDRHLSAYYGLLGKSLLFGRDRTFWDYHKRELAETGVGFSRVRLARGLLTTLTRAVMNPRDTIGKLRKSPDARTLRTAGKVADARQSSALG